MMIESGVYVRIQELAEGPLPKPLDHGFNQDTAYRAIGLYNPSETADAYYILANDRDETWFICNRHVRVAFVDPHCHALRVSLNATDIQAVHVL